MQSIIDLPINCDVNFARRHKHQLEHFFQYFDALTNRELAEPLLAYTLHKDQFDDMGTLWVKENELDIRSMRLVQMIEGSYMSTAFFSKIPQYIGSRGYVYYSSATQDDDDMRALLRLINHADTTARLLEELYPHYQDRWEFGIYALLDDLRYKLIILDEYAERPADEENELLGTAVSLFYDYLQGLMPEAGEMVIYLARLRKSLLVTMENRAPAPLRSYKEADHPYLNLVFRDTLNAKLAGHTIDMMIGIRFGGSELPHLMRKHLPHARIIKVKVSNYSDVSLDGLDLKQLLPGSASVLILDDNILTGRTLESIVRSLRECKASAAYFGCVSYSAMKRYPQMIMEGHGVVNTEVLLRACVICESQYTKITSSKSYKNSSGVFDKVKAKLQKRMNDKSMGYKL